MLIDKLKSSPIVPVYYNDDIEVCKVVLKQCYDGGVRVFEFVDRGLLSKENFILLKAYRDECFEDMFLGVGTIKTASQAEEFVGLGADFLVSPIVNEEIGLVSTRHNVPWIPGCMTPTEVAFAERLGASIVKLFPGDVLGSNYIKAIKPLFSSLNFMVTGGVYLSSENLKSWFTAGALAIGVGSKLFEGEFAIDRTDVVLNLQKSLDYIKALK